MLTVLPDAERAEEAAVEAAASGDGFVLGTDFVPLSMFVQKLQPRAQLRRDCSPLTGRIVLWSAARELGPGPYGAFIHEPAFARAALEVFLDLKAGGMDPAEFAAAAEKLPPIRVPRARYLARLYKAYENKMAEHRLADREDRIRSAIQTLERGELPLPGVDRILFRGLYDFSPSRRRLLFALAAACEKRGVAISIEVPGAGSAPVDACVDDFLAELERVAQAWEHVEAHKDDPPADRPLAKVGARLFAAADREGSVPAPSLQLVQHATGRDEARGLAQRAAEALDAGTPPERVVVAYRALAEEAEWVAEALEEMGVPARIRRGAPLGRTTVGRLALDLPLLVDDGFPAARVARLLGSRYLPTVNRGAPASAGMILSLASVRDDRLGAVDGRGAYDVRLSRLEQRVANLKRRGPADGREIKAVKERCLKLIAIASRIPQEAEAAQLLRRWWRAVGELGLQDGIKQPEPRDGEATSFGRAVLQALARDQAASEALNALVLEFDAALSLSGAGAQPMQRRTFARWLLDAAEDFNLAPRGPRGGAVRVVEVGEVIGRSFDHVLLGGVADGRFPGRTTPHALFTDDDRAAVNRLVKRPVFRIMSGDFDGRAPWRLAEDRLLLYGALAAATRTVTVSFARTVSSGQEQMPSPFIDELARVTGAPVQQRASIPVPLLSEVRTERELRERVAVESLAPRYLRSAAADPLGASIAEPFATEPWLGEARALAAIEDGRLRFFSDPEAEEGPHTGRVDAKDLAPALAQAFAFGADRPLTASALGRFGNCAFQGFLAYALRLEEPEDTGEEIAARDKGSFWHQILQFLFPVLKEKGLLGKAPDEVPEETVDAAIDLAAARAEETAHVGHPALWRLHRDRARAMVRKLLGQEHRGLPFPQFRPEHAELVFGRKDSPEGWKTVVLPAGPGEQEIHFEGKIDRIDGREEAVALVDYKSADLKREELRKKLLSTDFQLVLYLYAARAAGHEGASQAAWLSLKTGKALHVSDVLGKDQTLEDLLATGWEDRKRVESTEGKNFANAVHGLVSGLREGRFPIRGEDCRYCAYASVCRISRRTLEEGVAA